MRTQEPSPPYSRSRTGLLDRNTSSQLRIVHICGRLSTAADHLPGAGPAVSASVDMTFRERFRRALEHAKLAHLWDKPTDLGKALGGFSKQTISRWTDKGEPKPRQLFTIADKMKVDPRWLATEEGDMTPRQPTPPGLDQQQQDLIERYNRSDPRWQLSLRLLAYVATDMAPIKQNEVAGMVNVIIARAAEKAPQDINPVKSRKVSKAYGHVPAKAARLAKAKNRKTIPEQS